MSDLTPQAHALSLFRVLRNGKARTYTAVTFPNNPYRGCEQTVRVGKTLGWLVDGGPGYGVLDVLDENGDIVQDFVVTTAEAFRKLKHRLNLKVEEEG